jgi:transcriptional regulator with XRE-family HTH domain
MINIPNYLRVYRKKTPLTQSDIAFLLDMDDYSSISRYEKGKRVPSIDLLIMYHFLFNVPIEDFFEEKSLTITSKLNLRIKELIAKLKSDTTTSNNLQRAKYLEEVIINLNSQGL